MRLFDEALQMLKKALPKSRTPWLAITLMALNLLPYLSLFAHYHRVTTSNLYCFVLNVSVKRRSRLNWHNSHQEVKF
jgi:hypothetical protein